MVDDVIDATHWAIEKGVADKDRVCIYGASYGGYSALMSAVKAPDLYKCAIGYVGVYDLEAMKVKGDIPIGFRGRNYLERVLGSDSEDLKAQSPLTHAAKIRAKVMLIHGDEDIRVPSYHAKKMRTALKKANNPAEWLYLADAGHGAFSVENRTEVYQRLLKFLDENIGG
jgi:dipeptidyl aminopeptidase/acylaminoacyl peptidase